MKALLFAFTILLLALNVDAQNYWKTLRKSQGLIDSNIVDISATTEKIYLATPEGLSVLDRKSQVFRNYDTSNSNLKSQNIIKIETYQSEAYLLTDAGVSIFRNNHFLNLDTNHGLFKDRIRDIELNSKGELAISSESGLLLFKDSLIDTLSIKNTYDIGFNNGDSLYAVVNNNLILNNTLSVTCEVFYNNIWTAVVDTTLSGIIFAPRIRKLSNGRLGITSSNLGVFVIDSIFSLRKLPFPQKPFKTNLITDLEMDSNHTYWISFSDGNLVGESISGIYKCISGDCDTIVSGLPSIDVNGIDLLGEKVFIGSSNGGAYAADSIEGSPISLTLSTGNVKAHFSHNGFAFHNLFERDEAGGGFNYPKNSETNLIYALNPWHFGSTVNGDSILATRMFFKDDYIEGTINSNKQAIRPSMLKISKDEISYHLKNFRKSNYVMPQSIKNWPANGNSHLGEGVDQAPFVDSDNDGCYDPTQGDYPFILGDKALYIVFNDDAKVMTGRPGKNLKVEIHLMAYVFNRPNQEFLESTVFLRYTFINRSSNVYDMKSGLYFDVDLGGFADDYMATIPQDNIVYSYNGDDLDEDLTVGQGNVPGYQSFIPAAGLKIINTTLSSAITSNYTMSPSFPNSNAAFMRRFESKWSDGTPVTYGGSGYNPNSTNYTEFTFPGDPRLPNEWSELNPGPQMNSITPSDRVSFSTFSPYIFKPRQRKVIDVVVGMGIDSSNSNYLDNIDVLVRNLNQAARFQQGVDSIAPEFSYSACTVGINENEANRNAIAELYLYPNPTNEELNIITNQEIETIQVFDLQGREVQTVKLKQSTDFYSLKLNDDLPNGMYILRGLTPQGESLSERLLLQR